MREPNSLSRIKILPEKHFQYQSPLIIKGQSTNVKSGSGVPQELLEREQQQQSAAQNNSNTLGDVPTARTVVKVQKMNSTNDSSFTDQPRHT